MSRKPMTGIYVDSFPHGTATGYSNHGCRCNDCKEAGHARYRDYYTQNRERIIVREKARQARQRERLRTLPPPHMSGKPWAGDEDATVMRQDLSISKIAQVLQRSHKSVTNRRARLRAQGRDWT